jgi:hypothetical protein
VVASALFELSGFVGSPDRERYLEAATHMVDELASPAYLAEGSPSAAILLHGAANVPEGNGIDSGLSYGDHYFLEALARRPKAATDAGTPDAGTPDSGVPDGGAVADAPDAGAAPAPVDVAPAAPPHGCASGGEAAIGCVTLLAFALGRLGRRRTLRCVDP